jgi:hypothetical protein
MVINVFSVSIEAIIFLSIKIIKFADVNFSVPTMNLT